MLRYDCNSKLHISYHANPGSEHCKEKTFRITIWLEHHKSHTPYYDVSLPPEAAALIRENLEWFSPHEIAKRVLPTYPVITAKQVHAAWTTMSETLWKRGREQLPSVKTLLGELEDDVTVLDVPKLEGVEQIAWVMKKVLLPLSGKIVEIGIDATCEWQPSSIRNEALTRQIDNTNSRHLELYSVIGEYDNVGFPLSYCLLTTASSVDDGKRTRALEAWVTLLHSKHGVVPRFVHTDKDMAEIGASRRVWPEAKHQLCWWHQREALRRRLKGSLPTTSYNVQRATGEYGFIDADFKPYGRVDLDDSEGGVPGEVCERKVQVNSTNMTPLTDNNSDSIKIRIPISSHVQTTQSAGENSPQGGPTLAGGHPSSPGASAHSTDATKMTIRIPALSTLRASSLVLTDNEPDPDEDTTTEQRTFCPVEHHDTIVKMMERHGSAHPLIPGYYIPTPKDIKKWAVKQMYQFCVWYDLPNLWAYVWENWY